ncbi:HD domain-containing phosphohydrolase [Pseudomonas sp. NCCP-436]|uniref:HD domain-containing phosphohydrolase n=1 Tax=Pseudomonas sp. NCCP-436 TaxID=2842481 RepID=UPI001C80121D|nr:HD domain-containing phosphohydrolase [Pseudomonas sp. NCCP-436]GIZ13902.1 phosphodiesterase [Pseudomonas sp. NCCP-436]
MPNTAVRNERRFPLHVHISALFTLLLLLTGIFLGLFNYQQTSRLIVTSSEALFERIQNDVEKDLQSTYQPIRHLLSLLALNPATAAENLESRLLLLPLFAQALRDNPKLASLYLGYEDGDFFMVRPLRDEQTREQFEAPENSAFQIWSIDRTPSALHSQYLFYDDSLQLLDRRPRTEESYDPRTRAWFQQARHDGKQISTEPYLFFSTQEVGTTLARRGELSSVLGADLTLEDLSATLARHRVTPSSEVLLADASGLAVAYSDSNRLLDKNEDQPTRAQATELNPAFGELLAGNLFTSGSGALELAGQRWIAAHRHLQEGGPQGLHLILLVPEQELLSDAYRIRWQGALITLATLLLCLPLGWLTSRLVVRPLRSLVNEAEAIRRFDFSHPASGRSPILEVDQLAISMSSMKERLSSFLDIAASLSSEPHFDTLLRRIMDATVSVSGAQGGLLYLLDSESGRLEPQGLILDGQRRQLDDAELHPLTPDDPQLPEWLRRPASGGASSAISIGFDQAGEFRPLLSLADSPRLHLIAAGLHNRQGETVGVLVLLQRDCGEGRDSMHSAERIAFVDAVSSSAALCIESQRLLSRQKQLLDAFIQLIAGAIDAKSPYTGGHCQRVPQITLMLARAAAESNAPAFRDYHPGEHDWEALHIAAWLHDCGKVTTPEYVVDKATKLETLYDRIHEVRMRFEVLKRDAWIDYWKELSQGGDSVALAARREETLTTLDDEFAFVAHLNLGGETLAETDLQRLERIAQRRWLRTLDKRLGVSWEEARRLEREPTILPVEEPLLADRPEHLIERPEQERIAPDNRWGFQLKEPKYKFNRGELHNLRISRGTLTPEERYLINHHIVQTIRMLDCLPFPPHLRKVVEIAGGHHEKMDGSGYPRGLKGEQMSLPARMIAIADILEALTAADRPYKKGKTLSEALNIMLGMCHTAHIDSELFALLIRSGIHRRYAERFMLPEQIDQVDDQAILATLKSETGA